MFGGNRENTGGGGKNNSASAAALQEMFSAVLGRLLTIVRRDGTCALE